MAETLRLIGGRYDGERTELEYEPEPEFLHLYRCPDCDELHHLIPEHMVMLPGRDRARDETVYRLLKVDGDEAVYIEGSLPAKPWTPEETAKADELVTTGGVLLTRDEQNRWHEIGRVDRFTRIIDAHHWHYINGRTRLGVIGISGIL